MESVNKVNQLTDFYLDVQEKGLLRTPVHARQWTRAVLQVLGFHLDGRTKKQLAQVLPKELAEPLTRDYRLFRFRNPHRTKEEFFKAVALKGGNTDPDFARIPVTAVLRCLKQIITPVLYDQVAQSLRPHLRQLWLQA